MSVRWRKLAGDVRAAPGRIVALQIAIALALTGVGIVLGARAVLRREIRASFASTRPADATFDLANGVDDAVLAAVRARPDVEDADRRQMVKARVKVRPEDPWQMFVLFVADDFAALRLATFVPETGAWPPPRGALLLERSAPAVMGIGDAGALIVETPHGDVRDAAIAGTVHDAGQAPNWQEHRGCGYATLDTLAALGEPRVLHELLVRFRTDDADDAEHRASALAAWLRARGTAVREVRAPPFRQHPHQALMDAVQTVLLVFSLILLALCAIVVATVVSAMLARQVREIGVMKAIGANTGQLARMYAGFVAALGLVAAAIATPLAYLGAHAMIGAVARMMNIALADPAIPAWVYVAIAALGIGVPLAFSAPSIVRATRISVRRALAHHGAGADFVRPTRLPLAVRNALRRPGRLAMTMLLLVVGGALVITAANVQRGLGLISTKVGTARRYDLEIRLHEPIADDRVAALAAVPGVRRLEAWSIAPAALGDDVMHTFPDGGHGSFALVAPPAAGSELLALPVTAGRWLAPGDGDAVVLSARTGARVGERVAITAGGTATTWTVVGLVEEIGGSSGYVTEAAFRRATASAGHTLFRIAGDPGVLPALERSLAGTPVYYAMPLPSLRSIIDDHLALVVRAILFVAAILAAVGLIGLGSTISINVAERTREIGIMKAIGASSGRIFGLVVGEALVVGLASAVVAVAVALPLTALAVARIAVIAHPPFAVSVVALVAWPVAVAIGSVVASLVPALRATGLSVREALAET